MVWWWWCGYRKIIIIFSSVFAALYFFLSHISLYSYQPLEIKDAIFKDGIHIIHGIYQFEFDKEYGQCQLLPITDDCSWQFIIMTVFTSWLMCVVCFLIILQKKSHEMTWFCSMTNNCCYIESENSWNHWKDKQQRPLNERIKKND